MRGRRRRGGRLGSRHPTSGPSCRRRLLRREHAEPEVAGRRPERCTRRRARGRLRPDLLTPVRMAPPAAGSACRSRRGKRTEHVLAAEDALSLPRNARLARHHGQGNKMEHIPEGFILHIKVMAWAFGTMVASVCTLSLHLYCWLHSNLLPVQNTNLDESKAPTDAVATPPLYQLTTQPVTLSYVTVLIHSTELLELWNDQIPILLQRENTQRGIRHYFSQSIDTLLL
ncbi:uncharacterized protein [Triticum aestivum]|uniref:uncharacterized protein isoform X2 n=1 Tax=Triticum aestivum TaxID=4565 RepID=UPI001D014995|nr:uncharacterized protein LOC123054496 isoform X2 [Triticum aestivum]